MDELDIGTEIGEETDTEDMCPSLCSHSELFIDPGVSAYS
jgi:hypothetical protein